MSAEQSGMDRLAERLGPGVRDIERVVHERKGWAELHAWLDSRLDGRPDVTVGEITNRKGM